MDVATEASNLHVSRSGPRVQTSVRAFNDQIAGAAARADGGVDRNGDFVINRNVVVIHVINVNVVPALVDGRILFDGVNVIIAPSAEPAVANEYLSPNKH